MYLTRIIHLILIKTTLKGNRTIVYKSIHIPLDVETTRFKLLLADRSTGSLQFEQCCALRWHTCTQKYILVLNHGLKFAPSRPLSKFEVFMDIQKYVCKLNIQRYLITYPTRNVMVASDGYKHSSLSNASLFNPPGNMAPSLGVFRDYWRIWKML